MGKILFRHSPHEFSEPWRYLGKLITVWFDRPHGVQMPKGELAGWVKAIKKALKESGRLASR